MITLPTLPFAMDALAPFISKETLEFHWGKHHRAYVEKANELLKGSPLQDKPLEQIVIEAHAKSDTKLFNNAAQAWNHNFYWQSLRPKSGGEIPQELRAAIQKSFGSLEDFKKKFAEAAIGQFGSGWAWLVKKQDGALEITHTSNAENPLVMNQIPLLTCDVWEHAYYIDYRNARPKYVEAFWSVLNWEFAAANLKNDRILKAVA